MDSYRDVFRAEGIRALAFFPLVHDGALLGKFMIYANAPRELAGDELRLAKAVAAHIAQAVARQIAIDASSQRARARQRLVSVVAHDLRNPLGVAQLKLQVMASRLPPGEAGERLRKDLDVLTRSTSNMT